MVNIGRKKIIALLTITTIIVGGSLGIVVLFSFLPQDNDGIPDKIPDDPPITLGWIWVSGNKTKYVSGVYGTKGIPDSASYPGSRESAVSWIDSDNNLWLFGGFTRDESGDYGRLNDLWKYNGVNWAWMSGNQSINVNGIYGTKGDPDPANFPGSRYGALSWVDLDNNLWLFGGRGYNESGYEGEFQDLWKYDGGNWTWISGNQSINVNGIYGTKGDPDPANYPGSRRQSLSWTDSNGNFWLFGGRGHSESGEYGRLNDLWKFDGVNWIWMSGSKTIDEYGVYGTKGVPDAVNCPGGRDGAISWIDSEDNLWLFGGTGFSESGNYWRLNDLWKYNGVNWTWISGNKTTNVNGLYGEKGVPNITNFPGSRTGAQSWIDSNDNLWLFGGYGFPEFGVEVSLDDFWKFDGLNWTWMSGNKTLGGKGIYGIKGVPDVKNHPGSRRQTLSWVDFDGNFWFFGGLGHDESGEWGYLNDLWKYYL